MANTYPIGNDNYRLEDQDPKRAKGEDISVVPEGDAGVSFDESSNTTMIPLEDGAITISFGPPAPERKESEGFDENVAEHLSEAELAVISERLLMSIEQDVQSRDSWLQNMSSGISLLGLETKQPRGASVAGSTPAEGVSTVDHPLLLEAVLRFQANAYGELLPSDGPVKIRNDGEGNTLAARLSDALQKDLNHYLTKVAKEYYPDTDRMLLMLGFSGISFKKGYHDPIKRRPVIASIDAKDLIVSNAATDLDGAGRVTHRLMMRPSTLKRMQLVGAYRDINLGPPAYTELKNPVDQKIDQIQGIAPPTYIEGEMDKERELYECYCEIDIPGFEHEMDGEVTGLPLPYKVVLDRESRRILEIRRNWHEDDDFCLPRNRIIAYVFVPGLGFYGIGLLNILGNATKAVTAAWRLLIDAGMFSNFPGFLYIKSLAKQLTNQFRIAPGSGQPIDTVGQDIRSSVMTLPYKDPSAVFIQLIDNIATAAQRVGGTAELQVGEGKQDAPVGTTLAMVEQATKLMSAVHKRMHQAQGQEFDMLRSLLMEDPEALWRHNKKSKVLQMLAQEAGQGELLNAEEGAELRHRALFLAALADLQLVPAADPNTSSQTERYLKIVAMRQMASTNQNIDMNAVDKRAMDVMGIEDADSYFKPLPPPGSQQPAPEQVMADATKMAAQARLIDAQTKSRDGLANLQLKTQEIISKQKIASLGVAKEVVIHNSEQQSKHADRQHAHFMKHGDRQHDMLKTQMGQQHDVGVANMEHQQGLQQAGFEHGLDLRQAAFGGAIDAHAAQQDRQHSMAESGVAHQQTMQAKGVELIHKSHEAHADRAHERMTHGLELMHEGAHKNADRTSALQTRGLELLHERAEGAADRQHDAVNLDADRSHATELAEGEQAHEHSVLAREQKHERIEGAKERSHAAQVAKAKAKSDAAKAKSKPKDKK